MDFAHQEGACVARQACDARMLQSVVGDGG